MVQDPAPQLLMIRENACIGCLACSTVCPDHRIMLRDEKDRRRVIFERVCRQPDCDRCVAACPEDALVLQPLAPGGSEQPLQLAFEWSPCRQCARPVTTAKVLAKLAREAPPELGSAVEIGEWLRLCPACRRRKESESLVHGSRRLFAQP